MVRQAAHSHRQSPVQPVPELRREHQPPMAESRDTRIESHLLPVRQPELERWNPPAEGQKSAEPVDSSSSESDMEPEEDAEAESAEEEAVTYLVQFEGQSEKPKSDRQARRGALRNVQPIPPEEQPEDWVIFTADRLSLAVA